jgi:hypothetical protein
MADCNGFKVRGLNQAAGRVSVKSNAQSTWMLTYKRPGKKEPIWHEVAQAQNELTILKCEDGAEGAIIEVSPLGDKAGTMIAESSRAHCGGKHLTRTLRVGSKYVWELDPGESLICRTQMMVHPKGPGAGMTV